MAPYKFHRVLIAVAILFDFGFTFWAIQQYRCSDDVKQLILPVFSLAVTLALVAYLVYFNRTLAVLRYAGGMSQKSKGVEEQDV